MRLQRAYAHANRGDELFTEQKVDEALKEYAAAARYAPEILELPFWQAITMASVGRIAEAEPIFRPCSRKSPYWADLVPRLPAAGLLPDDKALVERIVALQEEVVTSRGKEQGARARRAWGMGLRTPCLPTPQPLAPSPNPRSLAGIRLDHDLRRVVLAVDRQLHLVGARLERRSALAAAAAARPPAAGAARAAAAGRPPAGGLPRRFHSTRLRPASFGARRSRAPPCR